LPPHEKARVEQLLSETKQALNDDASIDRLRTLSSDLNQAACSFSACTKPDSQPSVSKPTPDSEDTDDVIDADFTEK